MEVQDRDVRDSLVGNTMHAGLRASLLQPLLALRGFVTHELSPRSLGLERPAPSKVPEELRLVRAFVSYQSHRGVEIRAEAGPRRWIREPSW